MAERSEYAECSNCNKLYTKDQLEAIPDGFGVRFIAGPKSPTGWSKCCERRRVRFMVTKKVCFNCLGYNDNKPKPQSDDKWAAAAGFKRYR